MWRGHRTPTLAPGSVDAAGRIGAQDEQEAEVSGKVVGIRNQGYSVGVKTQVYQKTGSRPPSSPCNPPSPQGHSLIEGEDFQLKHNSKFMSWAFLQMNIIMKRNTYIKKKKHRKLKKQ